MKQQTQGIAGVVLAQTLLGTLGLCVLEAGADPISTAFYRCALGAVALGGYAMVRGELARIFSLPMRVLLLALVSGLLMVGNWVLFFEAIRRSGISVATIVFHVQPFIMVLLGAALLRERTHPVAFAWIGLALVGLAVATGVFGSAGSLAIDWIGVACALGAALLYALVTVIAKGLPRSGGLQLTLIQCLCGVLVLSVALPLSPVSVRPDQWGWFALIGIVHTGGVYVLLYNALPKVPTAIAAVLLFLYPVSAILVDAVYFGHEVSLAQCIGFSCILTASLGVTRRWFAKNGHKESTANTRAIS